ncbi:MAG: hypothetical protein ACFFAU_10285 [Candidatus Hodarchaeota archaeon]
MSFRSSFNYEQKWIDYGENLKINLILFWEQVERYCNFFFPEIDYHSKKFDKLAEILGERIHNAPQLRKMENFIWAIRLICKQPIIAYSFAYQKFQDRFSNKPNKNTPIPVLLKTWHAYRKILPEGVEIGKDYLFEIVGMSGDYLKNNEGNRIFGQNAQILDEERYLEEIANLEKKDPYTEDSGSVHPYVYHMRVLYQLRNNVIHAAKSFPTERNVYLLNLGNIALYNLIWYLRYDI